MIVFFFLFQIYMGGGGGGIGVFHQIIFCFNPIFQTGCHDSELYKHVIQKSAPQNPNTLLGK